MNFESHVSSSATTNIKTWLHQSKYKEYVLELEQMIADEKWQELEDSFFKVIEFGTGGRRGHTGVGSNRINRVTIGESAQALCEYAASFDDQASQKGIVIACDTRLSSPELSQYTAQVCAAAGFKTYIFESFRSTPELSFAVRELGAAAGIVISASHNPPQDNGFKAYWNDGAQLVAPHDKGVMSAADKITEIHAIDDFTAGVRDGLITVIGEAIDMKYYQAVVGQSSGDARNLRLVYSPLHGAGQTNVLPSLKKAGFTNIIPVIEQMVPDGNFPSIADGKPNPEEKKANALAVKYMLRENADIAITNDPDADRIGVVVNQAGTPIFLSGNQSAVLATEYALRKLYENGSLTQSHYIAKTIVTTDMLNAIADSYQVKTYDNMLIGFKYIGDLIRRKEKTEEVFVIGAEESFGLLKGDYCRDKDGATGALPLAEYAAELKKEGKSLVDRLYELYRTYGLFVERLDTVVCEGAQGFSQMQTIMKSLRVDPPKTIDGHTVTAVLDYESLTRRDVISGDTAEIDCVSGNVLVYELGNKHRRVTIRPSGTEPKLKFYTQWHVESNDPRTDYEVTSLQLVQLATVLEAEALSRASESL